MIIIITIIPFRISFVIMTCIWVDMLTHFWIVQPDNTNTERDNLKKEQNQESNLSQFAQTLSAHKKLRFECLGSLTFKRGCFQRQIGPRVVCSPFAAERTPKHKLLTCSMLLTEFLHNVASYHMGFLWRSACGVEGRKVRRREYTLLGLLFAEWVYYNGSDVTILAIISEGATVNIITSELLQRKISPSPTIRATTCLMVWTPTRIIVLLNLSYLPLPRFPCAWEPAFKENFPSTFRFFLWNISNHRETVQSWLVSERRSARHANHNLYLDSCCQIKRN